MTETVASEQSAHQEEMKPLTQREELKINSDAANTFNSWTRRILIFLDGLCLRKSTKGASETQGQFSKTPALGADPEGL